MHSERGSCLYATETEKKIGDLRDAGTPYLNLRFADGILISVTCSHKVLLQLYIGVSKTKTWATQRTKQNIENQRKSGTNGLVAC